MRQIFLSYRRDDARIMCDRIYEYLAGVFGNPILFRDIDNLPGGADFRQGLVTAVNQSAIMVVIIGPNWLTLTDQTGAPRIFDEHDFVRSEIEQALSHAIPILPLLVLNATLPTEKDLPPSIAALAFQQTRIVRPDPDFHRDMEAVVGDLTRYVPLVAPGVKLRRRLVNRAQRTFSFIFGVVVFLLTINTILNYLNLGINLPYLTDLVHRVITH